jgi:hypothetical protein
MITEELPYYEADTGHFPIKIKVCFSDEAFQQAVRNSKITARHNALDAGIAESHYITQEGTMHVMLGIVFNYEEMKKLDALERMGIIYHEVSHTTTHVFQYIGEDELKIGDESRSYLGEHIFKQVFAIFATEDDNRESARKRNRKASNETNQAIVGTMLQMALDSDGGAGQDSNPKPKTPLRRTKNSNGKTKPKTSSRIRRTG